jgi:DNA-binding transcriptional LysR family regulator
MQAEVVVILLAQIEAFLAVARHGSMREASGGLSVGQPAMTARIQALETELGVELFTRTPRGMRLTEAGLVFLPYAERAVDALLDGSQLVGDVGRGLAGELVIGAAPAVSAYVLPHVLARFARERPWVRLKVRTGHSEEVIEMVVRGDVRLGVVRQYRDARVDIQPLYTDELVTVARPGEPGTGDGPISPGEMAGTRFIVFARSSAYYDLTDSLLREAGVSSRNVMEVDNIEAAKRMAEQGLGIALLPSTAVADALASGALRAVDLEGFHAPRLHDRVVLVRRIGAERRAGEGDIVDVFYELLRDVPNVIAGARTLAEEAALAGA